jgi:hypothetical protein
MESFVGTRAALELLGTDGTVCFDDDLNGAQRLNDWNDWNWLLHSS